MDILKISGLQEWVNNFFQGFGLSFKLSITLSVAVNIVLLFLLCWLAYLLFRRILLEIVKPWIKKSTNPHLDVFIKKKPLDALAHLASGFLFYYILPFFFNMSKSLIHTFRVIVVIYIIVMILICLTRILHSLEYLGQRSPKFEKKPVSSYVQIILIMAYLLAFILISSILFSKNPLTVIGTLGAGAAILMLVFKDVILGLVASVQVSVNDMVRVGDWISVRNYHADGIVEEINLTTVQIRNWDMTLANVPTYALVSTGFDNVRERDDVGYRRLMHHLLIDIRTIKKVDDDFVKELQAKGLFQGDSSALTWSSEEEKDYDFNKVTTLTNLSLFRRYFESYILNHPGVNNTYMVIRQLQQDGNGLPIEMYGFVKSVSFKPLNFVQSDIFEHLYTVLEDFDLAPFQKPTGEDIKSIQREGDRRIED